MKKLLLLVGLLVSDLVFCQIQITDLKVTPISPFGKVILEFNVHGSTPSAWIEQYDCVLTCKDNISKKDYIAKSIVGDILLKPGFHKIEWDMALDGIQIENKEVTFNVQYKPYDYLVIDLVKNDVGVNVITYLRDIPDGGWSNEYKKTKLVFRRIEEDEEFPVVLRKTSINDYEAYETYYCKISQSYYISVFPITMAQISTSNSGSTQYCTATWSNTRFTGFSSTSGLDFNTTVGSDSLIATFRSLRTSVGTIEFDLPTLLQLRYATAKASDEASSKWFGVENLSREWVRDYGGWQYNGTTCGVELISASLKSGKEYISWPKGGLSWTTDYPSTCNNLGFTQSLVDVDGVIRPYFSASFVTGGNSEATFRLVFPTF